MRISDWSSDVCSSDLDLLRDQLLGRRHADVERFGEAPDRVRSLLAERRVRLVAADELDRKSVVEGKSVSVRVDLGGRRIIKKHRNNTTQATKTSTKHD